MAAGSTPRLQAGADHCLVKPFRLLELQAIIDGAAAACGARVGPAHGWTGA
jgi:hypothetical protein